jgi:Tfp pilus assembly protein PilX
MQLRELTRRCSGRLREQGGFTMLLAVFTLMITTLLIGGAYVAVLGDTPLSRNSVDQNRAYAAAQAGIQAFNYQLNQNENYWQTCDTLGPTTVPGSTDTGGGSETYTVTPMVASTAPSTDNHCDSTNALATMIEGSASGTAAGTFRVQSTGTSGNVSRTLVAQYKPPSFLQFVYYTDYETLDPSALPGDPGDCEVHYPNRGNDCGGPINFITGDSINGPLHSEDTLSICGSPVFGRTSADQIQAPNYVAESGGSCSDTPDMVGTYSNHATSITPPPDNSQLLSVTQSAYHFTGKTTIVLNDSNLSANTMTVTNANISGGSETVNFPSNGVVYVSTASAGCGVTYTPFNPSYTADTNCGNVYVSGAYSQPLTIASDNDIIINGNITTPVNGSGVPTTNALLGLIANDFVRIYHPLSGSRGSSGGSCNNAANTTGDLTNPTIYAAILAVNHSFIVDNYDCGATLGTLYVYGAIAQLFRGPVGTGGTEGATSGYVKSYNYDDRLGSEEPPYFLNPVSAQWYVSRETECAASASTC